MYIMFFCFLHQYQLEILHAVLIANNFLFPIMSFHQILLYGLSKRKSKRLKDKEGENNEK